MDDRVALITGATGGLGRVVAASFAADGVRLGLAGSDPDRLRSLATDLRIPGDRWTPAVGDLRHPDEAQVAVDAVVARFGRIDILAHLVGGWAGGATVGELDLDEVRTMLDQHLWTTMHVMRALLPGMVERGWGRIVAVSTPFASNPAARGASYAIAKAAEEALVRTVARENAGAGVTANLVVVRKIDTAHARETDASPKTAAWTTPEEIASTIRFLCSDAAAAINGARIPLDGRG